MGEAKQRGKTAEMLTEHVRAGLILPLVGSLLDGKPPEVVARFVASSLDVQAVLDEIASGRLVHVSGVKPEKDHTAESWIATRVGLGPDLLRKVHQCGNVPDLGSQIYPVPFGDDLTLDFDKMWFTSHPDRWLRIRPLLAEERKIGELNDGWVDRIVVILLDEKYGIRTRLVFGCREGDPDADLGQTDAQIAEVVLKYGRYPELKARRR